MAIWNGKFKQITITDGDIPPHDENKKVSPEEGIEFINDTDDVDYLIEVFVDDTDHSVLGTYVPAKKRGYVICDGEDGDLCSYNIIPAKEEHGRHCGHGKREPRTKSGTHVITITSG
jgi:hypothetical protein